MPPDPVSVVVVSVVVDVVVGAVVVVVVVGAVVVVVVVGSVVSLVVVGSVVVGAVVVLAPSPPPARAITAITSPITSAATSPIATFWPALLPPPSSRSGPRAPRRPSSSGGITLVGSSFMPVSLCAPTDRSPHLGHLTTTWRG
ncbi:MAG: hypothetical protein EDQ89_12810 [Acidobacteria bacterium]|nr:MAG: hypothetical protein EDQ89_12810 [Acidobacteriota bacterium]